MRRYKFLMLSIVWAASSFLLSLPAKGFLCRQIFVAHSEFQRPEVLLEFLRESGHLNAVYQWSWRPERPLSDTTSLSIYSGFEHRRINQDMSQMVAAQDIPVSLKLSRLNENAENIYWLNRWLGAGDFSLKQTFGGFVIAKSLFQHIRGREYYSPEFFFSSSINIQTARTFQENTMGKNKNDFVSILFEINGQSGRNIEQFSKYPAEKEVLYHPESRFKIHQIQNDGETSDGFAKFRIQLHEVTASENVSRHFNVNQFRPVTQKDLLRMLSQRSGEGISTRDAYSQLNRYSRASIEDFSRALDFVHRTAAHSGPIVLNVNLLKQIHSRVMNSHYFSGSMRRRIRHEYQMGRITEAQALTQLRSVSEIFTRRESDFDFRGQLRTEPIDHFIMTGNHINTQGVRYFTYRELLWMNSNPYFKVHENSVRRINLSEDQWAAEISFVPPHLIQEAVHHVLRRAEVELNQAINANEYIFAVLRLQQDLMSIHPFQDGNGRTIKLLSDLLYMKKGLPPPLNQITNEYTSSLFEQFHATIHQMERYNNFRAEN